MNARLNWVKLQGTSGKFCVFFYLCCIWRPLWDLCECQAEFGNSAKITEATVSF